jgi:tetratricopeptide (TPR) repeat protein
MKPDALNKIFMISLTALVVVLAAVALSSCDDNGAAPRLSAQELNEEGWERFSAGSYAEAKSSFDKALDVDAGLVEARLGLAWSNAQLGEFEASVAGFDEVTSSGLLVTDAFAGRAAAALELPDYSLSIASADSALSRDPGYFFSRQSSFNFGDLRLILAQSYFALARYDSAQAQVDRISPGNGLDPDGPETWVVGGTAYPTYEAALAAIIERLWALEGGL